MILITRGSSPLGRLVVRHLLGSVPPHQISVTEPNPHDADDLAELGIHVRAELIADPEAAKQTFAGAESVLIIAAPGNFGPGAVGDSAVRCVQGAIAAKAAHIVYTSVINVTMTHHLQHDFNEAEIKNSGADFTILGNNLQSEALVPALRLALTSHEFVCSFGQRTIAPASRTDLAEAAAIALTDPAQRNKEFKLSGPIGLTAKGIASVFAQIASEPIPVREVASENLIPELLQAGATQDVAAVLDEISRDTSAGEWKKSTDELESLIGHPRLPLVDALSAAALTGASR